MAKLFVAMAGLLALNPPLGGTGPGRVLLRQVPDGTNVGGVPVPAHLARVRFRSRGKTQDDEELMHGNEVSFLSNGNGAFTVDDPQKQLLTLGEFEQVSLRVREGCIGGEAGTQCVVGDKPSLAGRVLLNGGTVRPVEMKAIFDLRAISTTITTVVFGATSFDGNGKVTMPDRLTANGLLYEKEVGNQGVSLVLGTTEIPLEPEDLGGLLGAQEKCFVVWIVNTADPKSPIKPPPGESLDRDFHLLYDFAEGAPKRFVPQLASTTDDPPGDPPGHCMPGVI